MIIYMLFYIKRYKYEKKIKEKFMKKHMAEPFRLRSESGRVISSFDYEKKYKKLQKLVRKYLDLEGEK